MLEQRGTLPAFVKVLHARDEAWRVVLKRGNFRDSGVA
jgi:hypothetical protein